MTTILYLVGMTVAAEIGAARLIGRANGDLWVLAFWIAVLVTFSAAKSIIWNGYKQRKPPETNENAQ